MGTLINPDVAEARIRLAELTVKSGVGNKEGVMNQFPKVTGFTLNFYTADFGNQPLPPPDPPVVLLSPIPGTNINAMLDDFRIRLNGEPWVDLQRSNRDANGEIKSIFYVYNGNEVKVGDRMDIDLWTGWGPYYIKPNWKIDFTFDSGDIRSISGGTNEIGFTGGLLKPISIPPGYYDTPLFSQYRPNGFLHVPLPHPYRLPNFISGVDAKVDNF